MCLLETTEEVVQFFDELRQDRTNDSLLSEYLGINYDTCHLAIQFEEPRRAIGLLRKHGIKLSKIHVSSALTMRPTQEARAALAGFADEIYLHQAVVRYPDGRLRRYLDIDQVLECERDKEISHENSPEWRVHFHIPLHTPPSDLFGNTNSHILGVLDLIQDDPTLCTHLEMETYTWEVLPPQFKSWNVVEQLMAEYQWTLAQLSERDLV
jgi:hypothetical protein